MDVFRPDGEGRFPVIMCAHPYGKDAFPRRWPFGYVPPARYRFMRQPDPITFSAYTTWEAPDPSFWVPRGYAVVNVDLRRFGTSEGVGTLLSDQEASDYAEVIEWAAAQPWSNGKVGLNGVSYLAISQWKVAALRPKSLVAICPWEGWTDAYRDVAYPGGVREDGFVPFWAAMTERNGRTSEALRAQQLAHPERDDFWASRTPERIEVPALICASFSDQALQSRGCFEGFRRIGSAHRLLYTHRGGKWSVYYSPEALAQQERFFDCFLQGVNHGMRDAARAPRGSRAGRGGSQRARRAGVADREHAMDAAASRAGRASLGASGGEHGGSLRGPRGRRELRLSRAGRHGARGPDEAAAPRRAGRRERRPSARLRVQARGRPRAAVRRTLRHRMRRGRQGLASRRPSSRRRIAQRAASPLPPERPRRAAPVGEVALLDIEILPSATFFARGDRLHLEVMGRWPWRRSTFFGMFPGAYAPSPSGEVILHVGGARDAYLLVPRTR
jgi:predicted acyl esterase